MSFSSNYLKLREVREENPVSNMGGAAVAAPFKKSTDNSPRGSFSSNYLALRKKRNSMTVFGEKDKSVQPLQQEKRVHGGGGESFGSPEETGAASDALSGAAEETDHNLSKQTYDAGMAGFEQYLADRAARLAKEADKPWWQILAENYANSPQDTSIPANIFANVVNTYRKDTSYREPDARWSDQQRSEFGNLYVQNPQKAVQYAIELNNSLNTQEYDKAKKKVEESATKSGLSILGHTAGAIAAAPYAIADFLDNVAEYSARGTITPKGGDVLTPFDYSQAVTGGVSQHLNDTYGTLDEDIPIIGGRGWGDAYGLGVSAAQSAVGGKILGKTATLATFFSSAAAAGIDNAKSRGASDEQALAYGTISGAAEVLTEMIPVDELMKMGPLADWRGFFADIVKLGGEEFLGEGTSSAITKLTDYLALGDKSSYEARKRQYQEEKQLSREAAAKAAFLDEVEEVLFDAFGGFASGSISASAAVGGIMGASSAETKKLTQKPEQKESGGQGFEKYIQALEKAGMLPDKAGSAAVGSVGEHTGDITQGPKFSERNAASGSANSYDGKKLYADGAVYDYAFMTAQKPMNVATMPSLSTVKTRDYVNQEKAVSLGLDNASQIGREVAKGQYAIRNAYTNREIVLGRNGLSHSLDANDKYRLRTNARLSAIGGEIVRNAIPINGLVKKNQQANGTYAMACLVNDGSNNVVAIVTVDEFSSNVIEMDHIDIAHSVNGRRQKQTGDSWPATGASGLEQSSLPVTAISKISIADFLEIVNQTHRSILSEDVLRHFDEARPETGYYTGRALFQSREDAGKDNPRSGQLQQAEASSTQQLSAFRRYAEKAGLQLEAVQETALQTMEKLSAILGVKFYIYQSYGRDGKRYYVDESGREILAPNGKYYADGRIYVDLNAGDGGKGTMLYTVSHELTHFIRQWSKAKYEVLADFLVEQYGRAGLRADNLVVEQMAKARRQGRKLSWEEAHEEMVADSMEAMLTDGNVVRTMAELKRQDKTLWQKICRWFRNLAEDLKAVVEAYKGHKPDSAEGQMVAGMRDAIGKLESLYADALMDAGENFQAASDEQNSAALEVDPRYSIREGMTDQERYDDLKKKRITVISDSRISEYADDIASLEAIQTRAKSKAEKIIKPLAKKLGIINTPLTTADIEIEFLFTARGLTESSHKQLRYGGSYVDFAKTLINLDRVLETAVLIEVHGDKYADTSRANENLEAVYVLLGAFKDNSNIIPVQMEIKRSSDVGGRLYLTVAMTKIEADVVGNALEKDQTPSLLPASEYTLAEIFGKINPKDAHFLKYLPERFLNEQQLEAKKAALEEDARRIAGYGKKDAKEKLADQDSGIKAKADKGFAESVQKHLGSRNAEEALFNAQDRLLSADNFMGWTGEDWTRYFGEISREKGKMAAREKLKELASQGLILKEMLIHASAGTRGGNSRGAYTSSGPSGHLPLRGEGFPSETQAQQTAQIADAESYARRLQEVMPELAAENADAGWRRGQKEVTKQEIHNGLEKSGQYDKIAAEIRSVGGFAENAKVHIPSQKIVLSELSFDDYHINEQRKHNVTREMAEKWITESKFSVTVWNGRFEKYYGENGVVYVNRMDNSIRTAFSSGEFDATTQKYMEVLKKYGY